MTKDNGQSNLNLWTISIFLISIVVMFALHTQISRTAFAEDNNWYVGEGVTKF